MLSKKEWVAKRVVRWQGIKNDETKTVEGGYLYLRQDDGSVIGCGTRNVSSRAEAIAFHYEEYKIAFHQALQKKGKRCLKNKLNTM